MIRPTDSEEENPYEAPRSVAGRGDVGRDQPPWIYAAFSIYCFFMALLFWSMGFFVAAGSQFGRPGVLAGGPDRHVLPLVAAITLVAAAVLFVIGPFLPRRPWAWTYGLLLILVGNLLALPLALFWIRRQARSYYGRIPEESV